MIPWLACAGVFGVGYGLVWQGSIWWREHVSTEQVRGEGWAKTLAVAAENGWPPYVELPGLPRKAELAWRETYLRTAPNCHLYTWPDGRTEWLHTQPKEGQW